MNHLLGTGLRSALLHTAVNDDGEPKEPWSPSKGTQGMSLGQLLQKIRESQDNKDDNFRA